MFGFLKKENNKVTTEIFAPVTGEVEALEKVSDPVFAKKMMGDGFAVIPNQEGDVLSPVDGRIILSKGHAVGIKRNDGLEFLIHIGIDTVNLGGKPFDQKVRENQKIKKGQVLTSVDWSAIKDAGLDPTVMVLITNSNEVLDKLHINYGSAQAGQEIGSADKKEQG
ncbi:PTS glucose transporter subunit IIA [Oenococcus alcoholitolerans]|uniref:PTS sugar transporter subunit IIA n=1 Tax=Oenococcus alcoholitolerans TaxID=931074 RepID=UPI003F703B3A